MSTQMVKTSSAGLQLAASSQYDLSCASDSYGDWTLTLPLRGQVGSGDLSVGGQCRGWAVWGAREEGMCAKAIR